MAITLIASPGAANANTYCSLDDAEIYFDEHRIHSGTWKAATDDDKESALAWATRLLDEKCDWNGRKATTAQALRWPRAYAYNRDGEQIPTGAIPVWLAHATAEFAMFLLAEDRTIGPDRSIAGIERIRVGPISLKYEPTSQRPRLLLPPSVIDMIKFYCSGTRGKTLVRA